MTNERLEAMYAELTKMVGGLANKVEAIANGRSSGVHSSTGCSNTFHQVNIENGIQNKNLDVAVLTSQKENQDEMSYLKRGGHVGKNKRKDGRYKGYYMDNGKRVYVYGYTRKECSENINKGTLERDEKMKQGFDLPHKNMRLFAWLDEWFIGYKSTVSAGQVKVVKNCIRHIKENFRDAKLNDLNPFEIEKSLAKIISSRTNQPSTKVQKVTFDTLNMALREAKKKKLVKENVMENVTKTIHRSESRLAFAEQVQKNILIHAKAKSDYYAYFLFGFSTGIRPDEFSKIKKSHISYTFKTVFIDGTKTKGSKRTMPLFDPLHKLQDYLKGFGDDDYVFTASADVLNDELRKILAAIKIAEPTDYSLYSMRHSLHTRLNEQGIDANTIAKWLGNSPEIARKVYIKVMPEHEQRQAEKFNACLAI